MSGIVSGIYVASGAYTAAYQAQLQKQQDAADTSQAIGQDVVGSGAPFPTDDTQGPGPLELFA